MSHRELFLAGVEALEGKPVLWSMKGPDAFDCSGTVSYVLKAIGGPDLTAIENAQAFFNHTRIIGGGSTDKPLPGDLVFYGHSSDSIIHVATLRANGGVVSADGATSHLDPRVLGYDKALELAKASPANRVRFHPSMLYRSDTPFIAVHRNVFVDDLDHVSR